MLVVRPKKTESATPLLSRPAGLVPAGLFVFAAGRLLRAVIGARLSGMKHNTLFGRSACLHAPKGASELAAYSREAKPESRGDRRPSALPPLTLPKAPRYFRASDVAGKDLHTR
jgi:hypothetical protein